METPTGPAVSSCRRWAWSLTCCDFTDPGGFVYVAAQHGGEGLWMLALPTSGDLPLPAPQLGCVPKIAKEHSVYHLDTAPYVAKLLNTFTIL